MAVQPALEEQKGQSSQQEDQSVIEPEDNLTEYSGPQETASTTSKMFASSRGGKLSKQQMMANMKKMLAKTKVADSTSAGTTQGSSGTYTKKRHFAGAPQAKDPPPKKKVPSVRASVNGREVVVDKPSIFSKPKLVRADSQSSMANNSKQTKNPLSGLKQRVKGVDKPTPKAPSHL